MTVPTLKAIVSVWITKRLPAEVLMDLRSDTWLPKITNVGDMFEQIRDKNYNALLKAVPEFMKEFPQFIAKITRGNCFPDFGPYFYGKGFFFTDPGTGDKRDFILVGIITFDVIPVWARVFMSNLSRDTILGSCPIDIKTNNQMLAFFNKWGVKITVGTTPVTARDWDTVN